MSDYHDYERLLRMEDIHRTKNPEQTAEQRDFIERKHRELIEAIARHNANPSSVGNSNR